MAHMVEIPGSKSIDRVALYVPLWEKGAPNVRVLQGSGNI